MNSKHDCVPAAPRPGRPEQRLCVPRPARRLAQARRSVTVCATGEQQLLSSVRSQSNLKSVDALRAMRAALSTPLHSWGNRGAEAWTGPVKSARRDHGPNYTEAAGHSHPATPTPRAPPLPARRPHLTPRSRQAGDRAPQPPPGLPGAPTRQDHRHPVPSPGRGGAGPTPDLFVPDLQRLAADAVEDGEEAALERVFEHLAGGLLLGRAGPAYRWAPSGEGKAGGPPWPEAGRCSLDLPTDSLRRRNLDAGRYVREPQLPKNTTHPKTETTATASHAALPALNGGGGPPAAPGGSLRPLEPAPRKRGAQSPHRAHGLPVPSALRPRPRSASS